MHLKMINLLGLLLVFLISALVFSCDYDIIRSTASVPVTVVNTIGGVPKDRIVTMNTDPVPGNSGVVTLAYPGGGAVKISWDAAHDEETPSDSLSYRVYIDTTEQHVQGVGNMLTYATGIGQFEKNITEKLIDTLDALTDYYLSTMVMDTKPGNKVAYTNIHINIPENLPPVPGNSRHLTTTDVTSTSLSLSWHTASDEYTPEADLRYQVYYSVTDSLLTVTDCEEHGSTFGPDSANLTSVSITGLIPSTHYFFNVVVEDGSGAKSAYSFAQNTTQFDDPPVPGGSAEITTTYAGTTKVYLSWPYAEDDITSQANIKYRIFSSSLPNIATVAECETNGTPSADFMVNINAGAVSGLTSNTSYYFNIMIMDEAGIKAVYQMTQVSTIDSDVPPVPGNYGLITVHNVTTGSAKLLWTKATDAESSAEFLEYQVYYSLDNNISTVADCEANGTTTGGFVANIDSVTVSGLSSASVYFFNVIVKDQSDQKVVYQTVSDTTHPMIGDYWMGGIVFYLNGTAGLVCAMEDQSTGAQWGCFGTALTGCSGSAIGTGRTNTYSIISGCATAGIAARLCVNYTDGTYSDWFLMSSGEKNALITNITAVNNGLTAHGGTALDLSGANDYWTSTQMPPGTSLIVIPPTGSNDKNKAYTMKSDADKNFLKRVRAIRSF